MSGLAVAYVVSRYPAVSHTFIRREVEALRADGARVETISVRQVAAGEVLGDADRRELGSTTSLLPASASDLARAAAAMAQRPRATVALLRAALGGSGVDPRRVLWHLFYAVEAVLLWRVCARADIRHLHAHFANVGADVARLACRFGGEGWTWSFTMHGPTELADVRAFDLPVKVREASLVACISDFCRSQLMALVEESHWSKLHVVHCGIEPEVFDVADRAGSDRLRLLCVGRLVPEKGQTLLLEAMAELGRRGVDVEAVLVGDGPRREALEVRAAELRVDVRFAGAVSSEEVVGYYEWADVFCLPSFAEGVPVVLMEAMATAMPVVTTRIAGIAELVDDGRSGLLVAPGRVDLLADAIERLADDDALRLELGKAGREKVVAEFDAAASAVRLRQLLGELVDG